MAFDMFSLTTSLGPAEAGATTESRPSTPAPPPTKGMEPPTGDGCVVSPTAYIKGYTGGHCRGIILSWGALNQSGLGRLGDSPSPG